MHLRVHMRPRVLNHLSTSNLDQGSTLFARRGVPAPLALAGDGPGQQAPPREKTNMKQAPSKQAAAPMPTTQPLIAVIVTERVKKTRGQYK